MAFFDTSSAWSVYPYFESGAVIVSDINLGLFVLRPQLCTDPVAPTALVAVPAGDNVIELTWDEVPGTTANVYRSFGSCPGGSFELVASGITGGEYLDSVSGQVQYAYHVTAVDETGLCESDISACSSATTTGECTAPPIFDGLESVTNPGSETCALDLDWSAATPNCGAGVSYSVYRSTDLEFIPGPEDRVAEGLTDTEWVDVDVVDSETYAYVARATDLGSGTEDDNLVVLTGTPTGPFDDGIFAAGGEPGGSLPAELQRHRQPDRRRAPGQEPRRLGAVERAPEHRREELFLDLHQRHVLVAQHPAPGAYRRRELRAQLLDGSSTSRTAGTAVWCRSPTTEAPAGSSSS